jgi:hypothetical protein
MEKDVQLTWLDLTDSDVGVDQLPQQTAVERSHSGLGGTVDTTASVRLATSDRAEVDDHL